MIRVGGVLADPDSAARTGGYSTVHGCDFKHFVLAGPAATRVVRRKDRSF